MNERTVQERREHEQIAGKKEIYFVSDSKQLKIKREVEKELEIIYE